jgi:tetratricopeptide (TPR) repeat protein
MHRYEEALTDFNHALQLNPDHAWAIYESAVALRLLGSEGAAERWRRAVEAFQAESAGEGQRAVRAAGNLLVVLCGLPDWRRAQEQVEVFLSASTSRHQIEEVLNDLADLRGALPVDPGQLDPIVSRLEAALSQMS